MNLEQFKEIREAFKTLENLLSQGMQADELLRSEQFKKAIKIATEGGEELIPLGVTQESNWPEQMEEVLGNIKGTMQQFDLGASKKECQEHLERAKEILVGLNFSLSEQEERMIRGLAMKSNRLI